VLVLLSAAEVSIPKRHLSVGRWRRWPGNLGIVAVDTLILRLLFPAAALATAIAAEERDWGLLNLVAVPLWAELLIALVLLDLVIYLQHLLFHAVPALWRIHRVHHSDLDVDVTTALRFHPLEIIASMVIKIAAVAILGASALSVLIFEVVLNATAMWSHANIRLPASVDNVLRRVLVTPDMHRTHHSVVPRETHSNFGFNLAWWDQLFRTYRAQPAAGHDGMTIGVPEFRDAAELRLDHLLLQPLRQFGVDEMKRGVSHGD
jgi:sterol desaturase/sphingolipid hydroxylase (fatty acid hydroxylase superfamily)